MTVALYIDGSDDRPTIVLLHPIATSAAVWSPQVAPLASRFRVVRVDLPGHGDSAPLPDGAQFSDYADAIVGALDRAGIDRFALAGLSFGAMISMQIALRHRSRVLALTLACCSAKTPPPVTQLWLERAGAVRRDGNVESQVEPTLLRWFTPEFAARSPITLDWIRHLIRGTQPDGFIAAATLIGELDHMALLREIATPCLVIAGAYDQAAPPDMMRQLANEIADARFESIEAAHLANIEAPIEFTETIGRFFEAL